MIGGILGLAKKAVPLVAGSSLLAAEEAEATPLKILSAGGDIAGDLYKRLMRAQQAGLSPSVAMKQAMHDDKFSTYNKMVKEAYKRDGGPAGAFYKAQIKDLIGPIAKDPRFNNSKYAQEALRDWTLTRLKRGPDYRSKEQGDAVLDALLPVAGVGLASASLLAPQIKDSGMISAPRSETLADVTMGLRNVERRLEGSPASLLFPTGLTEYLETVNREYEDPTMGTRINALLD